MGSPRESGEGLRLGTVRRPPRGISKADYSRLDYFDLWLPELAPSDALLKWARSKPLSGSRWAIFARRYRAEMTKSPASRVIQLLAALSPEADFSVGCFCADEQHCHRSLLREILSKSGAVMA